jgi:integrase
LYGLSSPQPSIVSALPRASTSSMKLMSSPSARGKALAAAGAGDRDELMASTAAYSGLRWGELIALTIAQG